MKKILWLSLMVVIIDQLIKIIISKTIIVNESVKLINNFFLITNVRNIGAAFSMLSGNRIFLILISFLALIIIYIFCIKEKKLKKIEILIYILLIGGIIGNLVDRIIHGYVIDYLEFKIMNYNAPIFNFADICIVIGCLLLGLVTIKEEIKCKSLK